MSESSSTDHVLKDIVEPVNRYFHVPVSARIVSWLCQTRATPNQVSYTSILLGILSGLAFMSGGHFGMFWGGVLLELSLILDCVDGQLARATGQSSEWGRLLDGIGGYVAYLAVVFGITYSLPEFTGALAVVTVVCIMKAICFDYCKQYFTARVQEGTDGSRADVLKTYQKWSQSQSGILKVYFYYLQLQQWVFHGRWSSINDYSLEDERKASEEILTQEERNAFYLKTRPLTRIWRWNGHEFCLFLLAAFSLFDLLPMLLTPLAVVMTVQFFLTLALHRMLLPNEIRP
ncbi:MAG: CDP-alcohol phosphatidyltransferase family protein [Candidatus Nitrohelix vancouverensis]|uniref:CDP-alcohol phosphatidyltransferase family protein n=1 Tax=Candidatus Nitrohelix vancouverensis TaxID=2705534 RepID=A0A7T0G375_9BACT|nr:MAG: CDP-alcohol phosphatidyltransferase family protein [Candidatus Nitrohelix vancouverensis]